MSQSKEPATVGNEVASSFKTNYRDYQIWKNYWLDYTTEDDLLDRYALFCEMKEKARLYDEIQSN